MLREIVERGCFLSDGRILEGNIGSREAVEIARSMLQEGRTVGVNANVSSCAVARVCEKVEVLYEEKDLYRWARNAI